MKRIISIILAVFLLVSAAAFAEMGMAAQMSNEAVFNQAVALLQFYNQPESLQQAAGIFSNLPGSYNQAVYFVTYANAMLGIQEGLYDESLNQLETLKEFNGYDDFEASLQGYGLPSCADLAVYTGARKAEAEERYYDAYELYKQADIMDALIRAIALSEYKTRPEPTAVPTAVPTQQPEIKIPAYLSYRFINGQCTIVKYEGSETDLVIPPEIDGRPVTTIAKGAFNACDALKSITLPDSLTSIRGEAFRGCRSLTQITIPDSVVSVGENNHFVWCENLTEIKVSSDHPALEIIDGALFIKADKKLISYPAGLKTTAYTIPQGTDSIGREAFTGCYSLTQITIPHGVTTIGDFAFSNCYSLARVSIPSSVTKIGEYAFSYCTSLPEITIPDSVAHIGMGAFTRCDSLTIYCKPGSYAEQYAKQNSLKYSLI